MEDTTAGKRRGRPPRLSHDDIARAALKIGFPNLTFKAVQEYLQVSESTLFRYVATRDDLVSLTLEYVFSRIEWPPLDKPWRETLESYALSAWEAWESCPGSATESSRCIVLPSMVSLGDDLCLKLIQEGFSAENAVLACDIVFDLVIDSRHGVEQLDLDLPSAYTRRDVLQKKYQIDSQNHDDHYSKDIRLAFHDAIGENPLKWFKKKLHIVLDGLEALHTEQQ